MRSLADSTRIERLIEEWGRTASVDGTVYLAGGATAVLHGWRESTLDVDVKLVRIATSCCAIPRRRSPRPSGGMFKIARTSSILLASGLVTAAGARAQFEEIEPQLYRFPAIDPESFRAAVEDLFPL